MAMFLQRKKSQGNFTSNELDSGEIITKRELNDLLAIMDKHLGKSRDNCVGPLESKEEEQPNETFEDDSDNLEDAKKWTIRQKLSFTNRK